ncbi:MAG: DUF3685 domain-containing protein [Leptolyngbyaceae cyanobacterium]
MTTSPSTPNPATVRAIIVDEDPIFRLGLRDWLKQWPDFEVIEDIGDYTLAFRRLQARLASPQNSELEAEAETGTEATDTRASAPEEEAADAIPSDSESFDSESFDSESSDSESSDLVDRESGSPNSTRDPMLVIVGGAIATASPSHSALVDLCQQIKTHYPALVLLVLGPENSAVMDAIRQAAADGYVPKAEAATQLQQVVQQVLAGDFQWPSPLPSETMPSGTMANNGDQDTSQGNPPLTPATAPATRVGPLAQLRCRWRQLALRQIDTQLERLQPYAIAIRTQANPTTEWTLVDRWIILGRCRELHTARWFVQTLLATPSLEYLDWTGTYRADGGDVESGSPFDPTTAPANPLPPTPAGLFTRWQRQLGAIAQQPIAPSRPSARTSSSRSQAQTSAIQLQTEGAELASRSLTGASAQPLSPASVRATLFDSLRERLQSPLLNQTSQPLEIDILREGRKQELLVLVLHKLLTLLDDLRYSDVQLQQLQERRSQLFYDLWQSILTDYFGKYYVMQVDGLELEVVTILSQDARVVQRSIFDRIPFAVDLLAHFLFQSPLEIDGIPYALGTPEALERAEIILDNLVIQLGNSVIQPLLNHLADVELIKQNFYDYRCMSSRDIARFRNSLSWRYRRLQYVDEPTAIFESTHYLLTVQGMGLKQTDVYVSRRSELDRLSGIPLVVTLLLELRDALSPRLREAIAAVGSAVIYVLTDVIGRGIGLIGRGVIKGIGSAWQDPKNGM